MSRLRRVLTVLLLVPGTAAATAPAAAAVAPAPQRPPEPDPIRVTRDIPFARGLTGDIGERRLDVYAQLDGSNAPVEALAAPVVVSLHGGSGSKDDASYVELSRRLAEAGLVVFNASYRAASPASYLADDGTQLREALETVACAVRFARAKAARYGGDPARVTIVGQSAGGYMGLLVALLGDELEAAWDAFATTRGSPERQMDCFETGGSARVQAFVGFNGAYFVFAFAGLPARDPELWALADPAAHATAHPELATRFVLGSNDPTQPARHVEMVEEFSAALRARGANSDIVRVEAEHGYSFEPQAWAATLAAILEVVRR